MTKLSEDERAENMLKDQQLLANQIPWPEDQKIPKAEPQESPDEDEFDNSPVGWDLERNTDVVKHLGSTGKAPGCACGCGKPVKRGRSGWNTYLIGHHNRWMLTAGAPLCGCGCGKPVKLGQKGCWNTYIYGHQNQKAPHLMGDAPLCGCGCGKPVDMGQKGRWNSYRTGHQRKIHKPNEGKRKATVHNQGYSPRKLNLEGTLTEEEYLYILDIHFHRCHYCGKKLDKLTKDHKKPVFHGGELTKENIVPACQGCNSAKGTKDYKAFVKECKERLQMELF